MASDLPTAESDNWSDWLLNGRHGRDPVFLEALRPELNRIADRVLDGAKLEPSMTLADVGTGDGLVALRAIDRLGPALRVLLVDISPALLNHTEALARERGVGSQCSFLHCSADNLNMIDDASTDVVTTRAVLAYVANKELAFREFFRVLRPEGRISLAEPIFRDNALAAATLKDSVQQRPPGDNDRLLPLLHRLYASFYPDTLDKISENPLFNFTERDLMRLAQISGFADVRLEFRIEAATSLPVSWEAFLDIAPCPLAPPFGTILSECFTEDERRYFEPALRSMLNTSR
jgi:ubiquinone/menaquinone biosynthesis C-methylase UbiE